MEQFEEKLQSVLIFGAPGSGKGTQGKFLSSVGNHFHLSSGAIFRELSPDSPIGKIYHKYAEKGELLPDDITIEIWYHHMLELITTGRYFPKNQLLLLDGIPRTSKQAKSLNQYIEVKKIVVLENKQKDLFLQRLKKRALTEKRCDDGDKKILRRRMQIYEQEIVPLIQCYPQELIIYINADQRPLEVLKDILIAMSDLLS